MRSLISSLFSKKPTGPLSKQGLLRSDLWLDQPDALEQIDSRLAAGTIAEENAERLRRFVADGYTTLPLSQPDSVYDGVIESVERAWRERPTELAYAYHSGLKLFPLADEAAERQPSYRIADLHGYCPAARSLFLDPQIFELIELIFGEPAVATQSLTFEYGSQQALHRDPVHVQMSPPSHLAAAWIALEEIDPRCGPLTYIAGSHKLPYYQFSPGEYRLHAAQHGEEEVRAAADFDAENCRRAGLQLEAFTPPRGEALIWHHSLLHGGSTPQDPSLTRKSFVIHFTSQANYPRLRQTVIVPGENGGEPRPRTFGTDRLLEEGRARGFDNPLKGRE